MGRLIVPLKNRTEVCLFAGISALMLTHMNCHKPAGWRCVWVLFLLLNHVFILHNQLEIIWAMRDVRIACFHLRWLQGTSRQFLPSLCLFLFFFPVTQICLVTMENSISMTAFALKAVQVLTHCVAVADTLPDGSAMICFMNVNLDGVWSILLS